MPQRKRPPAADRRVQKTRGLLHEAIASLVHEKDYDDIVVKEVLGRANVGRSTFYTHFGNKDELLESAIREVVRSVPSTLPMSVAPEEAIIAFSLPILEYLDRHRRRGRITVRQRGFTALHEQRLQPVLAELIAGELERHRRRPLVAVTQIPPDLLAQHIAASFVLVLNWWIESASALGPREVNEVFRALITPILFVGSSRPHQ